MNISGFELVQPVSSSFCRNGYCSAITPLCFAGISSCCARNRSTFGWRHFSFGEHVCHVCFDLLSQQHKSCGDNSVWRHRMSAWRRERLRACSVSGRQSVPSASDFIAAQLLPWWVQCTQCDRWRQLPPRTVLGTPDSPFHPSRFTCREVVKLCEDPCSWPIDERTTLVITRHRDFLASIQSHAWLQGVPSYDSLSAYGIDLTGLSSDPLPGFSSEEQSTKDQCSFNFGENCRFSPVDLQSWERAAFPEMARFPTLYLAVRNMILCLWYADVKRFLTSQLVEQHCFIRGLLRIALCEHWIPRLIEEFTCRGFINIGACELPPALTERQSSDIDQNLSIRVVGRPHLTNAIATRQLLNSFFARKRRNASTTGPENAHQTFRVEFQPAFLESKEEPNTLSDFRLQFSPIDSEHATTQFTQQNNLEATSTAGKCCPPLTISLSSQTIDGKPSGFDQLVLPVHAWADRVYSHEFHPIACLARQANLRLRPVEDCLLVTLNTDEDSGAVTPEVVQPSTMVRMEFHVEAVLDMIGQLFDPESAVNLPSMDDSKQSVQEFWDHFDSQVRTRLTDLNNSRVEKQLIEFYLAAVEYDLTEPLTTNLRTTSCSLPTARLDQLPAERYTEFFTDPENSPQNWNISSISPHWLVSQPGKNGATLSDLSAVLLKLDGDNTETRNVIGISSIHEFSRSVVTDDSQQTPAASTPLLNNWSAVTASQLPTSGSNALKIPSHDGLTFKSLQVHMDNGAIQTVDWVILTYPVGNLRILFLDDVHTVPNLLTDSKGLGFNSSLSFRLFLPSCIRPLLVEDEEYGTEDSMHVRQSMSASDAITPARLITITLVYRTAWWRTAISNLQKQVIKAEDSPVKFDGDCGTKSVVGSAELFALLPADRDNRGFCHVFRDMCPELQSPGVLQTQVFAAAADHWWDKSDVLLTATIDRHVKVLLPTTESADNGEPVHLLDYHVARLQHPTGTSTGSPTQLLVRGEDNQQLRLKPGAWEELARQCHILFADLFSCPAESARLFPNQWTSDVLPFSAMDVLTSAVQSGLRIAELAVRSITALDSRSTVINSTGTDNNTSMLDSSVCAADFTTAETNGINTSNESEDVEMQPTGSASARARRFLKRKQVDNDEDARSVVSAS